MSGELEKSLRDEVDKYVNSRLSELQEEVARIQGQLNEAFEHLRERSASEATDNMYVAAAISEHMRAAHERGIEEAAAESSQTKSGSDTALIKAAIEDLDDQRTQADILNTLVNRAAAFAPRVAFFVIRNEQAMGWRARGFEGTIGDEGVRGITLPLSADTPLSDVARSRATWSGTPGQNAQDHLFLGQLGAEQPPQHMTAVPLIVRGRCVAVLYADSAALDANSVNLEAIETLVRVGSMAVELLAVGRPAPAARTEPQADAPQVHAPQEQATETVEQPEQQQQEETPHTPDYAEQSAPLAQQESTVETAPVTRETESAEYEPQIIEEAEPIAQSSEAHESGAGLEEKGVAPYVDPSHQVDDEVTLVQEAPPAFNQPSSATDFAAEQPSQPASQDQYAAPLGAVRQYGGADMELPVEVGEEERRLHNDARRFARLLVSEIKLYNEQKVREGRTHGDIYERLREDIDRSRQMYDKRVAPPVAARFDYFHQEIVNTLAEGDPSKLGHSYPDKH
ncbi:MAG TPA: hypothetical protein VGO91_06285 [Pyrinomonadaceae bacterium]|nr:hypothetical protein [Pyrinomonadaceae bacterium]